jgi:endoglucanase
MNERIVGLGRHRIHGLQSIAAAAEVLLKPAVLLRSVVCASLLLLLQPATSFATERAVETTLKMGRGINILGYDGIWDGGVDAPFKRRYFKMIRDAGFGHVRINLHGFKYMNGNNELEPKVLARLDWVVEQSVNNDLIPVIDEHDFYKCQRDPDDCGVKLLAFWKQLSDRYAGRYPTAVFELLNEPGGRMTQTWWNTFIPVVMRVIRARNPQRTVVVAAINSEDTLQVRKLQLSVQDRNIIVTVHYYKPMEFTHQGAEWSKQFAKLRGIDWGSKKDEQQLVDDFEIVDAWAKGEGRPIYLGEFGVYEGADIDARARYTSFIARTAERLGWSWAYWQFDHDFALFQVASEQWVSPILDALVPRTPVPRRRTEAPNGR